MFVLGGCGNRPLDLLEKAITANDIELVAQILQENPGMDLNQNSYRGFLTRLSGDPCFPPLHSACSVGSYEIVNMLIEAGADVNFCDPKAKNSPIEIATIESPREKCVAIAKLLVENGAQIQNTPKCGDHAKYAFFRATKSLEEGKNYIGEQEAYAFFLYLVEEKNIEYDEHTLMRFSIFFENVPILKYALNECHADINHITITGESARNYLIECLIEQNNYVWGKNTNDTLKVLLENGIDVTFVDSDGKTALDYAKEFGNQEAAELIQKKLDQIYQ